MIGAAVVEVLAVEEAGEDPFKVVGIGRSCCCCCCCCCCFGAVVVACISLTGGTSRLTAAGPAAGWSVAVMAAAGAVGATKTGAERTELLLSVIARGEGSTIAEEREDEAAVGGITVSSAVDVNVDVFDFVSVSSTAFLSVSVSVPVSIFDSDVFVSLSVSILVTISSAISFFSDPPSVPSLCNDEESSFSMTS